MAWLVRKQLDGTVLDRWELGEQPLLVGRGETAGLRVTDERVSREHFSVTPRQGRYVIEDLNSTNGTYVNGKRIREAVLKHNDRIRFGQTTLIFESEKSRGLATLMKEVEQEGKGLHTYLDELEKRKKP